MQAFGGSFYSQAVGYWLLTVGCWLRISALYDYWLLTIGWRAKEGGQNGGKRHR
jgi:hypothetical protein